MWIWKGKIVIRPPTISEFLPSLFGFSTDFLRNQHPQPLPNFLEILYPPPHFKKEKGLGGGGSLFYTLFFFVFIFIFCAVLLFFSGFLNTNNLYYNTR